MHPLDLKMLPLKPDLHPPTQKCTPPNDFAPPNLKRGCICIKIKVSLQRITVIPIQWNDGYFILKISTLLTYEREKQRFIQLGVLQIVER